MATGVYKCPTLRCAPNQPINLLLENYTDGGVVNVDLMEGPGNFASSVVGNTLQVSAPTPGCYVVRVECCRPIRENPAGAGF